MAEGWIKLHREIVDHWIWQDPFKLRAWLDLIMLANHKPKKINIDSQIITIDIGQHWTSDESLAKRWGWGRKKVRNFLKLLESDGMIIRKSTPRGTAITIVNYKVYQGFEDLKGTANGTTEEQPRNSQRYTNKNEKNEKNEKKYTRARTPFQDFDQRTYDYEDLTKKLAAKGG